MNSEVKISIKKNESKNDKWKLPVYLVHESANTLYQIVKFSHSDKYVLMSSNGYIQASGEWNTIEEVLKEHNYLKLADVELSAEVR